MSVRAQLEAIRASAVAIVAQTDALLRAAAAPAPAAGPCQHEARIPAPRMGNPDAWVCERCGHEGEGA